MTEDQDKLAIAPKLNLGYKKVGFSANREAIVKQMASINPLGVPHRLAIEMDDSGSMGENGMKEAHNAINAFLSVCNPLDTSVAVFPMNKEGLKLTCDYNSIRGFANNIWATGGTPLYGTTMKCLTESVTRVIIFSDGEPTDGAASRYDYSRNEYVENTEGPHEKLIRTAVEKKVPIDTVYIGGGESSTFKKIAEGTGGVYLHFTGPEVFAKQMKYLAPAHRFVLANAELKAKIERGESI